MRNRLLLVASLLLASLGVHAQCGVERWSIKVGTDSQAPSINLSTYISSTIYNFVSSTRPSTVPASSRVAPRETNQYQVNGTLTKYVKEGDSDYHLVIQDGSGRTMIIEIPSPNCVGSGSPFGPGIANARRQFDARFTATTSFKTTSTPVTVKGIGFWDYLHGQTGVAPNGVEVHPVLNITFGASAASAPDVAEMSVPSDAVRYPADVVIDSDGGRVRVFRGGDSLGDPLYHGGAVLQHPALQMIFVGSHETDQTPRALNAARDLSGDPAFQRLDRYGVETYGIPITRVHLDTDAKMLTDLDVQRLLSAAVEDGRIQHLSEETIYVVVLAKDIDATVGADRDWLSYHAEFHPSDLAMRFVVVRGSLAGEQFSNALSSSVYRAMLDPAGDGWF